MREKIIIALDVDSEKQALNLVDRLNGHVGAFKIGLQLFSYTGPSIVRKISTSGSKVFLDLKFFDIPNTTARAAEAAVSLGAFMFNVHASGGKKMLTEAAMAVAQKAAALGIPKPLLIGVTVLTSMSGAELCEESGVSRPLAQHVASLALLCRESGLDGVVASAREIPWIRKACGPDFLVVTPGVRPKWSAGNDQTRIVTPAEALQLGSDYLVIGRPVTAAPNPREAVQRILADISERG